MCVLRRPPVVCKSYGIIRAYGNKSKKARCHTAIHRHDRRPTTMAAAAATATRATPKNHATELSAACLAVGAAHPGRTVIRYRDWRRAPKDVAKTHTSALLDRTRFLSRHAHCTQTHPTASPRIASRSRHASTAATTTWKVLSTIRIPTVIFVGYSAAEPREHGRLQSSFCVLAACGLTLQGCLPRRRWSALPRMGLGYRLWREGAGWWRTPGVARARQFVRQWQRPPQL